MLFECFLCFRKLGFRRKKDKDQIIKEEKRTLAEETSSSLLSGGFNHASGIRIGNAIMLDNAQIYQTVHNTILRGAAALELLYPHTCPGAAMDSSARYPPPRCHPGTRLRISERLRDWLDNQMREHKMIWLSGLAGTGKSATAQAFAEFCAERRRLGAAFFFFRSGGLSDPNTVIPSIAYQLASTIPEYRYLLTRCIADDLLILQKTARVQLANLVVEPLSILQMRGHSICEKPLVIILDGIDECVGARAQCEIVEMIGEIIQRRAYLPLLWLLVSRPEPHLRSVFSKADFPINCAREKLLLDAETRGDIERYLRDSFDKIRAQFSSVTPPSWPSAEVLRMLTNLTGGLFAVASTVIRFVGDQAFQDPVQRLQDLMGYMTTRDKTVALKPLEMLDLLYSHILGQIPDEIFLTTKRLLFSFVTHRLPLSGLSSVLALCNFMRIDQIEFNRAMHKVSAVLEVQPPEAVAENCIKIYHTTFTEYLRDPTRSGRFSISEEEIYLEYGTMCLSWYKAILDFLPESDSEPVFDDIERSLVSHFKWIPESSQVAVGIARCIVTNVRSSCWRWFQHGVGYDNLHDVLSLLEEFDFRRMALHRADFFYLLEWLSNLGPQNTLMRTEPNSELENTLLESVALTVGWPLVPATIPLNPPTNLNPKSAYRFLFLGHGSRTCLFWFQENGFLLGRSRLRFEVSKCTDYTISDCIVHRTRDFMGYCM